MKRAVVSILILICAVVLCGDKVSDAAEDLVVNVTVDELETVLRISDSKCEASLRIWHREAVSYGSMGFSSQCELGPLAEAKLLGDLIVYARERRIMPLGDFKLVIADLSSTSLQARLASAYLARYSASRAAMKYSDKRVFESLVRGGVLVEYERALLNCGCTAILESIEGVLTMPALEFLSLHPEFSATIGARGRQDRVPYSGIIWYTLQCEPVR